MSKLKIDKANVSRSFNQAASNYDTHAGLQQKIACELISLVEEHASQAKIALDVGAGTGYGARMLQSKLRDATVVAVDIAPEMLEQVFKTRQSPRSYGVCADAEQLPFAPQSVDLIYSSSFVQWCAVPQHLFLNFAQVLMPGGWLIFSTYGARTLNELRASWAQIDSFAHTLEFLSASKLVALLQASGFIVSDCRRSLELIHYQGVESVLQSLKNIGARNSHHQRRHGLTPASDLKAMMRYYQKHYGVQDLVPASYEVLYFAARLPRSRR